VRTFPRLLDIPRNCEVMGEKASAPEIGTPEAVRGEGWTGCRHRRTSEVTGAALVGITRLCALDLNSGG